MPGTRASSKTAANPPDEDSDREDLNNTVTSQNDRLFQSSIEARMADMMKQIQSLQAEVVKSNQMLLQSEAERETLTASAATSDDTSSLTTALHQLNHTLAQSRPEQMHRLYDLPEFDGRPEDWPMFREAFLMTTEEQRYNDRQNMLRLQKALKGRARETVECLLIHSANVPRIIETLKDNFGRPEQLVKSQITRLRSVAPIAENRIEQIVPFATKVQNLASFLEAADCEHHLCNPTLMDELVHRLSVQRRLEWARHSIEIKPRPSIRHFSDWLQDLARLVNSVSANFNDHHQQTEAKGNGRSKFFHADVTPCERNKGGCILCSGQHGAAKCKQFSDVRLAQRWRLVRQRKLCFNCLKGDHRSSSCEQQNECSVKDCSKKFHTLLHDHTEKFDHQHGMLHKEQSGHQTAHSEGERGQHCGSQQERSVFTSRITEPLQAKVLFKIVQVKLFANGKEVLCYAFLDEGSAVSLINNSLADRLGLEGAKENLTLLWFGNKTVTEVSTRVSMQISGVFKGSKRYDLVNVRTVKDLELPTQTLDISKLDARYRHLRNLPVQKYSSAVPEILIGLDNAHLGVEHRVITNKWKGPIGVRTKLGWIVYETEIENNESRSNCSFFAQCACEDELDQLVKNYLADDNLGVSTVVKSVESKEMVRAKQVLEKTTTREGTRFVTGLLWRCDEVKLPESRAMALTRLFALEKKFQRNHDFYLEYSKIMKDYEMKGFSRKLSDQEVSLHSGRNWYLPHFGIYNPNKPGKLRLVFDAAAKVQGVSLNSALLSGPDINQPLTTILFKFRQKEFAVCADIVQMFHQVGIKSEDQMSQRFLWRYKPEDPIIEYAMAVMTFGATCSPCSAQFVKNRNASDFQALFPDAVKAIINNHYVDDFVHCFSTEQEALKITKEVVWIHKNAGFELSRFTSNSSLVNQHFNDSEIKPRYLNLDRDGNAQYQKVLGMHWNTQGDSLKFVLSFGKIDPALLKGDIRPTKRNVLSITMSVFDPFGIAAEYSLVAKLLLQSIWRARVEWDERIPDEANNMWIKWLCMLKEIEKLSVPRCYSSAFSTVPVELHVFADASEMAYAAVAYWRVLGRSSEFQVSFVVGKTKCAPLKLTSIPRLELQSAVMATRMRQMVITSHDVKPTRVVMWSDSSTVLSWIKSDHRRYKPYVAHRINEILESTTIEEWRWVPSAQNPADFGTRIKDGKRDSLWISGPEFLQQDESKWPLTKPSASTNEEVRKTFAFLHTNTTCTIFERFSDFNRLKRVIAWILRFRDNCVLTKTQAACSELQISELERAENIIIRSIQMESYPNEYHALIANKAVDRSSSLWKLTPCLDEAGVIRLDGRINNAVAVLPSTRNPAILPKSHHVTNLVVKFYHQSWKHKNELTVIAEIRRKYWIPSIRVAVRRTVRMCQACKNSTVKPTIPIMGQLPEDRLTPFVRPFTYTGLDFMGPFSVTIGRRCEKRWIALFTCLTTRAIHLEVARDLSTDTCLMCLRNFMNRRGCPVRIRSDNATNFVGADRELKKNSIEFDQGKVSDVLSSKNIEWIFNCPLNPHAGGSWERLVRNVKTAMGHALKDGSLQEHSLYSLMCEAENIINSRPLTHIPLDSPTDEPLTPNHFLLGTANSEQTPHPHEEKLQVTRKQWRKVQQIQHSFWKKWLAEYLPDLCRRTKWYQPVTPLSVDDIVLVCDSSVHRSKWPLGRVVNVYPGKDSQVRAADVKVKSGLLKRPACMLAKLDVGESRV